MKFFAFLILGIIMGPTVVAISLPSYFIFAFAVALCGFLFVSGLELKLPHEKAPILKIFLIALGAFFVPFLCSLIFLKLFSQDFGISKSLPSQRLVFAIAISVSAVPVIIQLLKSYGYYNTETGHIVLGAAVICDLMAWSAFALVIAGVQKREWLLTHISIVLFFVGILFTILKVFDAKFTDILWRANDYLFGPVFFASIGLKMNLLANFHAINVFEIIIFATTVKMSGAFIMARLSGLGNTQSWTIASFLNSRGAMEVVLAGLALQSGIIDGNLFTSLVAMAFGTTFLVGPLLKICRN